MKEHFMKLPTIIETEKLLSESEQRNPGAWIGHSKTTALCAKAIAEHCDNLDVDTAYIYVCIKKRYETSD